MPDILQTITFAFAVLSVAGVAATAAMFRRRMWLGTTVGALTTLLLLSCSALVATVSVSIQGYRALTKEELAAVITVEPVAAQRFTARVALPDSTVRIFDLAGDQLYVDAHILKWKSIANLVGLHTTYELDRVGGRYERIEDETTREHTVFPLSQVKRVDMFDLRRRFRLLNPLVDAEYGSGTFIASDRPATFQVLVSTTGLLIRRVDEGRAP